MASVFIFASLNILEKHIMSKHLSNPIIATIIGEIIVFMATLPILFLKDITIPPMTILLITVLSGFVYFIAIVSYWKAVSLEEISRVIGMNHPLYALFTVMLAVIFLNEALSPIKYVGMALIILASGIISLKSGTKLRISKALLMIIICALFLSIHSILIKYVLSDLSIWNVFFWSNVGTFFAVPFIIPFYYNNVKNTIKKNKKAVFYLGISSVGSLIAGLLIIFALSYGHVSLVTTVESTQPILTLLMAMLVSVFAPKILKEELKGSSVLVKLVAISMGVVGIILLI